MPTKGFVPQHVKKSNARKQQATRVRALKRARPASGVRRVSDSPEVVGLCLRTCH